MEAQPATQTFAWGKASDQVVEVDVLDRELLRHAFKIYQLASDSRQVLLPTPAHQLTIVVKVLNDELYSLVDAGRVAAARTLLASSAEADAAGWAAVLTPPSTTTQPRSGRSDFGRNAEWLRSHRGSFSGMWVALYEGALIGHDKSRVALHRRLEAAGKLVKGTLFTKVT